MDWHTMWGRMDILRRQIEMKSILLAVTPIALAACNPQSENGCNMNLTLDELNTRVENINNLVKKSNYLEANKQLDVFFEFYEETIRDENLLSSGKSVNDDSGMKLIHAEVEIKKGNLEGTVIEKLSIARGSVDYFAYLCDKSHKKD